MPLYDFIYGTMDKSTDKLYDNSIKGKEDTPHVVHLTHLTTLQSIYQLRLGFSSLAAQPYSHKWYTCMMWPLTFLSILLTWICGSVFTVERNKLKKIRIQTWVVPRYIFQYSLPWEREVITGLIEKAISEAEESGVKVMCLCLLNHAEELNRFGEVYLQKYPKLKLRIVDGNSLAVAVVLKNIPQGTNQVLLRGNLSKMTSFGLSIVPERSPVIVGEVANFVAYAFAPAVLVTPLGALSIIVSAVLAHFILKERLHHLGILGCVMCITGSVVIVIHAPQERMITSVQEIWNMATQPAFLMYVASVIVLVFILVFHFGPRCGHTNVLIFTSICSLMGYLSVMSVKASLGIYRLQFQS